MGSSKDNLSPYGSKMSSSPRKRVWLDDESLWQEFQLGDMDAYAFLYKTHSPTLYSYGRHLGGTHEQVKDCIQELFEQLWNNKHKLSRVEIIRQYLVKSYRRLLLRVITQERKKSANSFTPDFCITPSTEAVIIEQQASLEQQRKLTQAMNLLSVQQREALYLKFYQNLSYPDIAAAMKISITRVYNLISRAIRRMKTLLNGIVYLIILLLSIS